MTEEASANSRLDREQAKKKGRRKGTEHGCRQVDVCMSTFNSANLNMDHLLPVTVTRQNHSGRQLLRQGITAYKKQTVDLLTRLATAQEFCSLT
jgi:hypothetical protein